VFERRPADHRFHGNRQLARSSYSRRSKLLLVFISLIASLAVCYHVYTEKSIARAIHDPPVEEEFEDYGACEIPSPCWEEEAPVDCECY
jgi:hypothetical protein